MSRRNPRPCSCGYPRVHRQDVRHDLMAPPPQCLNPTHPKRPACPKCGGTSIHKVLIGGHLVCEETDCMTNFAPRAKRFEPAN